jgi:hypothetical protein
MERDVLVIAAYTCIRESTKRIWFMLPVRCTLSSVERFYCWTDLKMEGCLKSLPIHNTT